MADKVPVPADEKPESAEPAQKENVKSPVQSDESGLEPSTDKSLESAQISPMVSSGVEVNEPESSERETTSPEPETEAVSGISTAVSGTSTVMVSPSKTPFKSAIKLISVGTAKVMRKISPKKHDRSRSPERPEDVTVLKPQKTEKLWKLSPKAQNVPAEVEPFIKDDELEPPDETSPKSEKQIVSPENPPEEVSSPLILPKKREVAYQRLDSETSDDSSITVTAKNKKERFGHKLPDSAELGQWTAVRLTQDTDWSRTTDQSMAESSDDLTDREVFSTSCRMSERLGLSENEEKVGCSEKLSEIEKETVSVSPRKTPVKRQRPDESAQEKRDITNPSPSKRRTLWSFKPGDGPTNN